VLLLVNIVYYVMKILVHGDISKCSTTSSTLFINVWGCFHEWIAIKRTQESSRNTHEPLSGCQKENEHSIH